jgi:hypothetical protein
MEAAVFGAEGDPVAASKPTITALTIAAVRASAIHPRAGIGARAGRRGVVIGLPHDRSFCAYPITPDALLRT